MKPVLHVVPSIAPRDGGPSAAVKGMCRALAAAGVPVLVATTDADGGGRLDVPTDRPVTHDGVTVRFFPCQFSERFKYSAPLGRWLTQHVGGYAVVHVHAVFSYASMAAGRACRRARVPYVVRPLGTIDPRSLGHHPRRKQVAMRLGAGALLAGAVRLHYTSAEEQRRAEGATPGLPPGVVVPLGVPDECFVGADESLERPDGPIVTVSRLDPIKGIDLVIRAFHAMSDRHPVSRLVIAGDGDRAYVDELRALAHDGPGRDRIRFAGWVDAGERRRLLSSASVFVMASRQENFGLAMVEAMAAGTPVVAADALDLAGRIEAARAGWVSARSVEALADVLSAALTDSRERARRARFARALADEFRWASIGGRLARLYEDIAAGAAPAAVPVAAAAGGTR